MLGLGLSSWRRKAPLPDPTDAGFEDTNANVINFHIDNTNTDNGYCGGDTRTGDLAVRIRGRSLQIKQFTFDGYTVSVSVDGGAFVDVSCDPADTPTDGGHYVTVASELSEGYHTILIRSMPFMMVTGNGPATVQTLKVNGSYPSLATPSFVAKAANDCVNVQMDGSGSVVSNWASQGYDVWLSTVGSVGHVRFRAACTQIRLLQYPGGTVPTMLYRNGVPVERLTISGDSWQWTPTWSGLDRTEAEYQVKNFGGVAGISVVGTINPAALTENLAALYFGDSTMSGFGLSDVLKYWMTFSSAYMGKYPLNKALAGSKVHSTGGGGSGIERATTEVVASKDLADRVVILYGRNDLNDTGLSAARFQADYETMLGTIVAGMNTGTTIYCLGILPSTGDDSVRFAAFNAAIVAAVASVGGATFVDTTGWIVPADDTYDGLHLNDQGAAKVGVQCGVHVT